MKDTIIDQKYKYSIELEPGDTITLNGIPYELMERCEVRGNTHPKETGLKLDWGKVKKS